jgi:hypothetical protein
MPIAADMVDRLADRTLQILRGRRTRCERSPAEAPALISLGPRYSFFEAFADFSASTVEAA